MTDSFIGNATIQSLYGLDPAKTFDEQFSPVSIESLLFFVVASAMYLLELLFDEHKTAVDNALALRLTHNRQWYVNLAKAFQFGDALNDETGGYDVIDASKQVVSYSAVDEIVGQLNMKVAKLSGTELAPLSGEELTAFVQYIQKTKDAGVRVNVISTVGDSLQLVVDVYYDPLVLDASGILLSDGETEPVKDTIRSFIRNLPFNGEFVVASLVDALQATAGVKIPTILSAQSKYGANDWVGIDARVKPNAGYLVIADEDLTITYRPYDVD